MDRLPLVDYLPYVLVPAGILLALCIFSRLRTRHNEVYKQLGSPLTASDDKSERRTDRFLLFSSEWRQLNDPTLGVMLIVFRILLVVAAASILIPLVLDLALRIGRN